MGMFLDGFFCKFLNIFPLPLYHLPRFPTQEEGVKVGVGGGWCILR